MRVLIRWLIVIIGGLPISIVNPIMPKRRLGNDLVGEAPQRFLVGPVRQGTDPAFRQGWCGALAFRHGAPPRCYSPSCRILARACARRRRRKTARGGRS